jgi:uncharacterized phiE125 gp8 family phage protein
MRQHLALITPAASDPVTLDEAKQWARIDTDDDNDLISGLITSATIAAEEYLCRSIMPQTWRLTIDLDRSGDCWWDGVMDGPLTSLYGELARIIPLPRGPVQNIMSVVTYSLQNMSSTYASSNYRLDASGGRLILNYGAMWPSNLRPEAAIEVLYSAGYASLPRPIKTGIMVHVSALYEQRGMCEDPMALPPAAQQLYSPYRILGHRG